MIEKRLKLAEGRNVPLEDGSPWPAEGKTVEVTLYIRRRLRDGDLVEAASDDESGPEPAAEPDPQPVSPAEPASPIAAEGIRRKGGK